MGDIPNGLASFPLLTALLERRSRRFGAGFRLNGGPLAFESQRAPRIFLGIRSPGSSSSRGRGGSKSSTSGAGSASPTAGSTSPAPCRTSRRSTRGPPT